jgi:putative Mg2+ transporter-C (MgtC) family protein
MPELPANWHEQLATVGIAALAALFGALIGFEREMWGKPAGLRTHALIAFACAMFIEVGRFLIDFYAAGHPTEALRIEVFGILSGVAFAIGIVASGTVARVGGEVKNLTTAGTVLCAGIVGVATGLRQLIVAAAGTAVVVSINLAGGWYEQRYLHHDRPRKRTRVGTDATGEGTRPGSSPSDADE